MNLAAHRISGTSFSALAAGGGGAKAVGELCAAQASKNRLLVRLLVDESRRTGHRDADLVARAYESLADVEAQHPEEVGRCLRYPAVGAWALRTHREMPAGGGDPGRLAAVALAAAIRAGAPALLEIPAREGTLMLPSVGRLTLPAGLPDVVKVTTDPSDGGAELRFDRFVSHIDFEHATLGWQVLRQISGTPGILLTIDDLDPYRWPGDDAGGRLPNERWQSWTACVRWAWRLLKEHHETVAEEVAAAVSVLTPLTTTSQSQHSACARDAFGTIALTDPLDCSTPS
jgi:HEXXH motif-containing protein